MNPDTTVYIPANCPDCKSDDVFIWAKYKIYRCHQCNHEWPLKPTTISEITNQNQPASVTVDDLCRQLEGLNPWTARKTYTTQDLKYNAFMEAVNQLREQLQGKIITTEQAIEVVVKKAFETFQFRPFPHNEPTWEQFKSTYLKEKFNTTSQPLQGTASELLDKISVEKGEQPVKTNEDILVKALERILVVNDPKDWHNGKVNEIANAALSSYRTSVKGEDQDTETYQEIIKLVRRLESEYSSIYDSAAYIKTHFTVIKKPQIK